MMDHNVPRPVLLALSILAGVKVLASAAVVADLAGPTVVGLTLALLAAVDMAVAFYLQAQVVPVTDVVAYYRGGEYRSGGHTDDDGRRLYLATPDGQVLGADDTPRGRGRHR